MYQNSQSAKDNSESPRPNPWPALSRAEQAKIIQLFFSQETLPGVLLQTHAEMGNANPRQSAL